MRVAVATVDELLQDLNQEAPDRVFQRAVRVSILHQPIGGTKRDAAKFQVALHASAVVQQEDGSEYILEVAEDCGFDYHDSTQSYEGSEQAEDLKKRIVEFCGSHGLVVRPGIIEM